MTQLALFDLDHTLLPCDSDYEWGQFLIDAGVLAREAYERQNEPHRRRVNAAMLAGALLLGWALGLVIEISDLAIYAWIALLAGGVILNVLKEELPAERESRFSAFVLGVAGYALVLLGL